MAVAAPLDDAKALLSAGDAAQALEVLERLSPADQAERQEVEFLIALALIEAGRPTEAANRLRAFVANHPELIRPRLELGRALMLSNDHAAAREVFTHVLQMDLPDPVRRNVERMLNSLPLGPVTKFRLSTSVGTDSNVNAATSAGQIYLDGISVPFTLSPDARAQSRWGIRLGAEFDALFPTAGATTAPFVNLQIAHAEVEGGNFDDTFLRIGAGLENRQAQSGWRVGPFLDLRSYAGALYSKGGGAQITWRGQNEAGTLETTSATLTQSTRVGGNARSATLDMSHDRAWKAGASDPRGLGAGLQWVRSDQAQDERASLMLRANYGTQIWDSVQIGLRPQILLDRYTAPKTPYSSGRRVDATAVLDLTFSPAMPVFGNVTPQVSLGWAKRDSVAQYFEYRRFRVSVGMNSRF